MRQRGERKEEKVVEGMAEEARNPEKSVVGFGVCWKESDGERDERARSAFGPKGE